MKTFPFNLLDELLCPCCGSRFEVASEVQSTRDGLTDGILRCDCYEYPVVSGIAVLRQMSRVASNRNIAVDYLRQRDSQRALLWLLGNGGAAGVPGLAEISSQAAGKFHPANVLRKLLRKSHAPLQDIPISLKSGFKEALQATRPRGYADYLFHRFANPSFLGAIPLLVLFGDYCRGQSPVRVLDLLCGVGHSSAIIGALWPELDVVDADVDFVNLFLAQRFLAPRATAVCVDAELPLPFIDSLFGGFFCLDGLHYIRSKVALLREVDRIVRADGIWAFAHMHNAMGRNENAGTPLSAEGYAKRFIFGQQRIISEEEVLRQFQTDGSLDLTLPSDPPYLASSHALSLVGSRTETLWKKHTDMDNALWHSPELVGFNPLYQMEKDSDGLLLTAAWPSEALHRECTSYMPALPESVRVARPVIEEIVRLKTTNGPSDEVRKLLRSCVLVNLPDCYPRPGSLQHI